VLFIIQYNRKSGRIVSKTTYEDTDREKAYDARLKLELELNGDGVDDEVVLLEAANEEILRRTHRRYFETLRELTSVPAA
jgi:hypothetical protein